MLDEATKKLYKPPMGWNSWNYFGYRVTEHDVMKIADAFCDLGYKNAGYEYIVIDDHWHGGRSANGKLYPDKDKFPSGIKALSDYIHSKGLKFGIYSDAGELTCGGEPGSYGFEETDAKTFADWGVDFLKYDFCNVPEKVDEAKKRYLKMSKALQNSGREILFSMSEWGVCKGYTWGKDIGATMWRTTLDLTDYWDRPTEHTNRGNCIRKIFDLQLGLQKYQKPGFYNDPDMLVVGLKGKGYLGESLSMRPLKPGCSDIEYRSHMSMWCMLSAPLMIGANISNLDKFNTETLLNPGIISIDQDPLCKPCSLIKIQNGLEFYSKELVNSKIAIMVLNTNDSEMNFKFDIDEFIDISKESARKKSARDVWSGETLRGETSVKVLSHEAKVFILEE